MFRVINVRVISPMSYFSLLECAVTQGQAKLAKRSGALVAEVVTLLALLVLSLWYSYRTSNANTYII